MRPHLILHSVLLEDVNGLQQGQFIDVFGRLKSGHSKIHFQPSVQQHLHEFISITLTLSPG